MLLFFWEIPEENASGQSNLRFPSKILYSSWHYQTKHGHPCIIKLSIIAAWYYDELREDITRLLIILSQLESAGQFSLIQIVIMGQDRPRPDCPEFHLTPFHELTKFLLNKKSGCNCGYLGNGHSTAQLLTLGQSNEM